MNINTLDKENGFLIEKNGHNELVVIFGGINQGIGIPVFEFFNILNEKKVDKVFVRDFNQMWYLRGVDNQIDTFEKLLKKLENLKNGYKKVSFIGNSMGGYASILFGVLLNVDEIVCFSPQTFIDSHNRFWSFDRRWKKQIHNIHKEKLYPNYYDLKTVLREHNNYSSQINLHFCKSDRLDRVHANRIKSLKNIRLKGYLKGGHQLVKELKNSGELEQILTQL